MDIEFTEINLRRILIIWIMILMNLVKQLIEKKSLN